ncbi:capsule biosynthesis protein CapA [Staphylococcus simiae]|uniref:YveK family protein n=1 Tax=Staphylococcus simiae TaxID=308354 RepID=UPI001A99268B|nr:Wzz/FepE/Etk N-terminal domain-containing protein [Staphylococcus simiae]MBO1198298.1 capsule biosynthesis protein CapA [Staphylococcus simiae]MBO1201967.1 capsule biosynthesis protein CapA [Staphylococcus simiae]MBO1204201.1 capsule biosynthesis protein CapA [Staphylococcus simiae]MBO1210290.1 capsule biosynthesis protein CapA [Staphylococcus simiae]MBO1230435.1 capsule biosynthesis protein CapA [Staphylococcus simiae]
MNKNITLRDITKLIKENLLLIVSMVIIFGVLSFLISQFIITPKYEATSQVIINQKKGNQDSLYKNPNEVQTNIQLIKTYSDIINSNDIKAKALKKSNLNNSKENLNGISISSEENSQIIKINVLHKNPKSAVKIANNIANLSKSEIKKVMGIDNLSILSNATNEQVKKPASPNKILNTIIGLLLGLVIALLIIIIKFLLNNKISTEKEVENLLSLPTIGKISDLGDSKNEQKTK